MYRVISKIPATSEVPILVLKNKTFSNGPTPKSLVIGPYEKYVVFFH